MKTHRFHRTGLIMAAVLGFTSLLTCSPSAYAQTANVIQDSFTGATAQLPWKAFNGACLTAGSAGMPAAGATGIPACNQDTYYGTGTNAQTQTGLNSNNADPVGSGALRLTNGCANGTCYYHQNGVIIDTTPYSSNNGIQVTFTTYTYGGDNSGGHGADGIGFYLMGAATSNSVSNMTGASADSSGNPLPDYGSWGGSLGYDCSNTNSPYDGMPGAYLGLGMDEFGNFLNNGDNTSSGDQATSSNGGNGAEYQPGRIGLRAYGNVNLAALQTANPNATQSDVQATCKNGGTYQYSTGTTTTYTYSYTYPPNGNYTTLTAYTETFSTTSSNHTHQRACSTNHNSSLNSYPYNYSTGGAGNANGTPVSYSGTLYQQTTSLQNSTPVSGTTNVDYNGNSYSCDTSSYTTTTTYSYTPAGTTASSSTSNTGNGYTGTGTPFALVNGNYYPLTVNSSTQTQTNYQTATFPDYAAIPGAYVNLPSTTPLADETATNRANAIPVAYKLQITQSGLLSLWYSYNGGTYNPVLTNSSITAHNAPVPANLLFGFGGSTGGSDNVHEITCFQVTPADLSSSSAGVNVQQSGEIQTGTEVYLAYYHPNNWWGELDADALVLNSTTGVVSIDSVSNWDASCVLTGGACTATNTTSGTAQTARTLLTWDDVDGNGAINFSNTGTGGFSTTNDNTAFNKLGSTEQGWLNAGDNLGALRLAYLSGDRSNEVPSSNATSTQVFRDRNSALGDIIDSSPVWVGPPANAYSATWADNLYPTATIPENVSGAQTYPQFIAAEASRMNMVYNGANDGFLHGFESGYYNSDGSFNQTGNDGKELVAYMPEAIMKTIHNSTTPTLDYSNPQYSHNYYVDATPGYGDLFYGKAWHTWLVGGLGIGGNAIYALDITNPGTGFSTSNVIGEWNPSTLTCATDTSTSKCGSDLGQTYGTPQIRRLHNGEWGVIFGNGFNSSTGHAAIYVMTITSTGTVDKVYYLDTGAGSATNPDGIAYVSSVDMDNDHVADYVYAGDYYGNVWRFDLTSNVASNWHVTNYGSTSTPAPLFSTPTITTTVCTVTTVPCPTASTETVTTSQPITTQVVVTSVTPSSTGAPYVMVEFGTGAITPQTPSSPIEYAPGQQALYGVWDWDVGQTGTPASSYNGLAGTSSAPSGTIAFSSTTFQVQTVTSQTASTTNGAVQGYRTVSSNTVCYVGTTCAATGQSGTQYGWYMDLPGYNGVSDYNTAGASSTTGVSQYINGANQTEQVIYNPIESEGAFIVSTTVPANNSPLTCNVEDAQGWTMGINPGNGGAFSDSFFADNTGKFINTPGSIVSGVALNGTGSPSVVMANGTPYLVTQTVQGAGNIEQVNPPGGSVAGRLTWLQLH